MPDFSVFTEEIKKKFLAFNEALIVRNSNFRKFFGPSRSRDVPPVSRAPTSEIVLQRGGLPSEITLPGETSSPELCIEEYVRTSKNQKNIFG